MPDGHNAVSRLAIIIESTSISVHEAHLVDAVRESFAVDLLVASRDELEDDGRSSRLFRLLLSIEMRLVGLVLSRIKNHRRRIQAPTRPLSAARNEPFDHVLVLTRTAVRPSALPTARQGVLRLHYGDMASGREGPPGFWELCLGRNTSGWWLMRKTGTSSPSCIFSGQYKTKRLMSLNDESVQREAHVDLAAEMLRLARGGDIREVNPDFRSTRVAPGILDGIRCQLKAIRRESAFLLRTKARKRQPLFSVGTVDGHWQQADLAEAQIIPNPPGGYLADPFLAEKGGQKVCYVEEFEFASGRGRISWLDLTDGSTTYKGTLIEEPYHMSFPFVFDFEGELYMIPETHEAAEIGLYRCTAFPHAWEKCGTLMESLEASDTMVFPHADRWWMLTNIRPPGANDFYSRLHLFWSHDPIGTHWTPHPLNPVLVNADGGRNGGILRGKDGSLYRVGQIQSILNYGAGWCINRIDLLSTGDYQETRISVSTHQASDSIIGGHHLHALGDSTVIDILSVGQARTRGEMTDR